MKKLILILIAATMTLSGFAAGTGDGSSKANAIEFDWVNGNTQDANTSLWYVVTLADRLKAVDDPSIALYLSNLSSSSADVNISAIIAGEEEARNYTIVGNGSKVWNSSASMLVKMGYDDMFVKLTTTQKIHLAAKVYEGSFADEACLKATDYDYKDHSLAAGTHWYTIDLNALRESNEGLEITYSATTATSKIVSMISTDCPSTGLAGLKGSIPNKKSKVHEIPAALIQSMTEATLYLKVENSKEIAVSTKKVAGPAVETNFASPTDVTFDTPEFTVGAAGQVFRTTLAELLKVKKNQPQITLNNEANTTPAFVTVEIAFNSESVDDYATKNVIIKKDTVVAGESDFMDFARNIIESLDAEKCKYVYVRISANQNIKVSARLKHMREGNACAAAQAIKWNEVVYQDVEFEEESSTQWYAIDITDLKTTPQDVTVTITNRGEATANVTAEVAFECPYIDVETISRKVEVGKPLSKTVKYSTIAMLGSNVVYVGVTTTQPVKVEVVPAAAKLKDASLVTCVLENAIPFNWEEGHKQAAGVTVWYEVPADNIIGADYIPEIIITNEGDKTLTIHGELATQCPDIYENQERALTIGANGTYKKEIAKDLVKNLQKGDKFYIKLNGNQPFSFRLNKKIENEGANCTKAIPFNWTTGHNQDADVTLWYVIDLTEIQNTKGKKVHVLLKNLTGKDAVIDGMLAPECPCTSPQSQSLALKANQVREKDIARSTFMSFGEKVYIRLTSTQKFHFEASIIDADPFTPITVCEPATDLDVNKLYNKTGDNAWYKIKVDKLVDAELAPRVMVINGATAQSIKGSIAYECPVTEEMQSVVRSFAANQTISKLFEQSLVNQLKAKGIEYVYVNIEGNQDYQFRIDMVDPNTGADCMHAVEIKDGKVLGHEAGKTLWYKLNVADLLANHANDKLIFSLTNTDAKAGAVHAAVYTDCEGEQLIAGNATIGANAKREKAIMVEALMGLNTPWVYLQLTAAQAQNLLMQIVAREKLDPAITACEDAVRFAVNTDYKQGINTNVWYMINLKEIRENTSGDATLIVNELSGEENTLTAELAWVCPVEYEMTTKSMILKGNDKYTRIFSRELLNSAEGKDVVYVRVTSEKEMSFRVEMHLSKGDECANPIDFDWVNGNTNPQGACLWYNVAMLETKIVDGKEVEELRIPEGKDLQLTIVNLSDQKVSASADLRFECKEHSLGDGQYTFEPNETKTKVIDRDLITSVNPTSIVVNFCTPKASMYIRADFIDELPDSICFKDIALTLCDGEVYDDVMTTTVIKHTIDAKDATTLAWNDTVSVRAGTILVDSIYRFTVTPMEAATAFDYSTVADADKIVAKAGEKLDYSAFDAFLKNYYTTLTAADSLAAYDTIVWEAYDVDPDQLDFRPIENVKALQENLTLTTQISLAYTVYTECETALIVDTIWNIPVEKGCDDAFDMTTLTLDWGKAYCGLPYDDKAVEKQIQAAFDAAGVTDNITIYVDLGDGFKAYDGATKMEKGKTVKFYAEAVSTCDATLKSQTATQTLTVDAPDAKGDQVTTLPLVDPYNNGWLLIIDLVTINKQWDLNLVQGDETDKQVKWYRMKGATPDPDNDELVRTGGYYLTALDKFENEPLPNGTYYAVISIVTTSNEECGGEWRTIIQSVSNGSAVGTRKHMINGKLYIITEDNVMYDAQGQKVQQ